MKKVPYGISDYKKLKEEDFLYVDKTMYLERLENVASTVFYLRPGRFGKSLFTSMMYYYYDVNSKDKFDILFKYTYVYDNPTSNKNNYYMLKFDFSNVTTGGMSIDDLRYEFNNKVIDGINVFLDYYGYKLEIKRENKNPNTLLLEFLSYFRSLKLDKKLYILIDEYDNFTNGILDGDTSLFKSVVNENGFVKSFYALIKEYMGLGIIDRFFATGICPVTLNSMTTGFNIATDITTDFRFNSMIGLTHDEVLELLNEYDKDVKDEIYDIMIKNYDGYLFSRRLGEDDRVFNATLVMYFLDYYNGTNLYPEKLFDSNITVNYEKIDNLLKLQGNDLYKKIISRLLENGEIISELKTRFSLAEDFSREDIISLLYYFGYLTVGGVDDLDIVFKIPNEVMKKTYNNYFIKILKDYDVEIDFERNKEYIREIVATGKIDKITDYVSELLEASSNRIFMNFNEKYVQLLYYTLLRNTSNFKIYVEYPCNMGYVDIFLEGKKMDFNIIIELKYIKKKEYSRKVLEEKRQEGIKQLEEYSKDTRLNSRELKKYLVVFMGNDVKVIENI